MTKWRENVKKIAPYVPGKSIEKVEKEYNLDYVLRLASNENPLGPSPKAIESMGNSMKASDLYPDSSATLLRKRLASLYDILPEQIITGNGADNVISFVISAYVNDGDEVLYCSPTFPAYYTTTCLMGGNPIEVPLNEKFEFDLDKLRENITNRTKLIFICNPNNPTGTIVDSTELEQFIADVAEDVTVVLDEAYIEYVNKPNYQTGIDFFKKGYKVISIRTFSKFYGLAGLRVGYAVASEEMMEPMLRLREPFAVNRLAIVAAVAAIDDIEYTNRHLKMNEKEKCFLKEELRRLGFVVYSSAANFLFVHVMMDAEKLSNMLLKKGIIIRPCGGWGYDKYVRFTVGTRKQNEHLIQALNKILNTPAIIRKERN